MCRIAVDKVDFVGNRKYRVGIYFMSRPVINGTLSSHRIFGKAVFYLGNVHVNISGCSRVCNSCGQPLQICNKNSGRFA